MSDRREDVAETARWEADKQIAKGLQYIRDHYGSSLLTDAEFDALDKLTAVSIAVAKVIGDGPMAGADWREAAAHIHDLQQMVMSQAAARAYPARFRLLGEPGWREK